MKVEDYNKEFDNKANIINRAIAIFNSSTTTAEDVASSIKSVELICTTGLLDSFEDFYPKLFNKITPCHNPKSLDNLVDVIKERAETLAALKDC